MVCANIFAIPLLLVAGIAGSSSAQVQDSYQISINVDLVVLETSVLDGNGGFASGLREKNFEIHEDGVRQCIRLFRHEDVPVTVGLVVDHSGSMKNKLTHVIAAARTFIESSSPEDEIFVVNFNENVTTGLPAAIRFSNRPDVLARAISNSPATGKTALYDAVIEALDRLRTGTRNKKALIVISDGGDNASAHSLRQMLNKAGQSSALVYTIGVFDEEDPDRNPGVLRRLARATGGESFLPGRLSEVVTVCEGIARDIRNQYTLAYVSTNASQSGAWRTIRVVVHSASKQRLSVRTRNGYIAAGGSKPADADGAP